MNGYLCVGAVMYLQSQSKMKCETHGTESNRKLGVSCELRMYHPCRFMTSPVGPRTATLAHTTCRWQYSDASILIAASRHTAAMFRGLGAIILPSHHRSTRFFRAVSSAQGPGSAWRDYYHLVVRNQSISQLEFHDAWIPIDCVSNTFRIADNSR
jgi:hypothetical protein